MYNEVANFLEHFYYNIEVSVRLLNSESSLIGLVLKKALASLDKFDINDVKNNGMSERSEFALV